MAELHTPYYLIDQSALEHNLEILAEVQQETGCRILLAQKAFSMFSLYPLIGQFLCGTTASGLYEARLAHEHMGKENHIFSPAYTDDEFDEILSICGHIVFNSFSQWQHFKDRALAAGKQCGIRINPEFSTQEHGIYDPCAPGSRLGVTRQNFREDLLEGISGLHFHCLCEQDADALQATLEAVEDQFGEFLPQMEWINFGGGHHITKPGYDIAKLMKCIHHFQSKYGLKVYLEPGEAVALEAGVLVATVIDLIENGLPIAILDASAACHMPDVLEMPYRPRILHAGAAGEKSYTVRLGGPTCLAGDIIGDYSFDQPLTIGDRITLCDMAIYSMVKNNTFNGMKLPDIALKNRDGEIQIIKQFGYEDFKNRLS